MRRQGEVVQKLAHMIGHSVKLYDMVLQFLRTLFLRTKNIHYCTLRAELLMALHDLEVNRLNIFVYFIAYIIFFKILLVKHNDIRLKLHCFNLLNVLFITRCKISFL